MAKKNKTKAKAGSSTSFPPGSTSVVDPEDDNLMNDLLAQLDSKDETVKGEPAAVSNQTHLDKELEALEVKPKQSAKSRFQARLARKAAAMVHHVSLDDPEIQARLEKEVKDEEEAISRMCKQHNRQLFQINPDGHCLYSAVADQLSLLGRLPDPPATYIAIRAAAADYIESHADDFLPFLPTPEEESAGSTSSGLMSAQQFQQYCHSVRRTAVWGGEPEIQALSRAFNVPIYVVQSGAPSVVVYDPLGGNSTGDTATQDGVWLSYHRKLFGLGEAALQLLTPVVEVLKKSFAINVELDSPF